MGMLQLMCQLIPGYNWQGGTEIELQSCQYKGPRTEYWI